MGLDGGKVVKLYLENLAGEFSCHYYGDLLNIITPYLYHDDSMVAVYLEELPEGKVKVHDGGEAVMHPFSHGFDLWESSWGMEAARDIARDEWVDLDGGKLSKTGPAEEVGQMILDVVTAARGVSDLIYAHRAYAHAAYQQKRRKGHKLSAFPEKLTTFLAESGFEYAPRPKLTGGSGQVYTVHYRVAGGAYLQILDPGRSGRAKAAVDRAFGMWADGAGDLTVERKLTLLNDETLNWKAAHINRLSQVSTVVKWSERDKLPALLAALS